jgi:hypothetical protein
MQFVLTCWTSVFHPPGWAVPTKGSHDSLLDLAEDLVIEIKGNRELLREMTGRRGVVKVQKALAKLL